MDYCLFVKMSYGQSDLKAVKDNLLLGKSFLALKDFVKLAALYERHNKVDSHIVLKHPVDAYQKGVINFEQNVLFPLDIFNLVLLNKFIFPD